MSRSAIRETLGFVGVMASLIFVGMEIRQNTLASQAAAIQEATTMARQWGLMFVTDPEVNRIDLIGRADRSQLNVEDQARYTWIVTTFMWGMQGMYRQWELGVLPDQEWQAWNRVICQNVAGRDLDAAWLETRTTLTPDFVEIIESCESFQGA